MLPALLLAAIAVLVWALFMHVLKPHAGFSFVRTPLRTLCYFLAATLAITALYFPITGALYANLTFAAGVFLLAVLVGINPWIYRFAQKEHKAKLRTSEAHPDLELLVLDGRFLLSKLGDVLFQQTVMGTLILLLAPFVPSGALTALTAGIFFAGHLGLILRLPPRWSAYFLASALAGGALLPSLILLVPGGFYYVVGFHMLWYVVTGAFHARHAAKEAQRRR